MTDYPLTFKCNDNCVSCIANIRITSKIPDPSLEQIKTVIDKINPDNDYFGISGGEPTLRKELFDILEYAKNRHPHMYLFLLTNGRMFQYKIFAKKLSEIGLTNLRVAVALYDSNSDVHEKITRSRGSFEQTIKGIKNLLDFGIRTEIRVIINKLNYMDMENVARLIVDNFPNIDRFIFVNMKVTGNAYKNRDRVMVKISDVVPFAEKAAKILIANGIETRLYHFPLCLVPERLWDISKGITKNEIQELTFVDACKNCKVKEDCPRIWKSYVTVVGDKEFKPVV
jgi:His-Xaa-Ser system radical SAM maturase HxsC